MRLPAKILPSPPIPLEIVSARLFSASQKRVFAAWTDPRVVGQWWGAAGFANASHAIDLRPGGRWTFSLRGPDGAEFAHEVVFDEIARPRRIVYDHVSAPRFRATATFEPRGARTLVSFRMRFASAADFDRARGCVAAGNEQNFDQLERALAGSNDAAAERELFIARVIAAPRARVFEIWTRRLSEWWGPRGMATRVCEMQLQPGGLFKTIIRAPDGAEHPTCGVFLEAREPECIAFTDAYEIGWRPSPCPFYTAIVTFDALPGGRTQYIARALHWSAENCARHERMGFFEGWGESCDRLAELAIRP